MHDFVFFLYRHGEHIYIRGIHMSTGKFMSSSDYQLVKIFC